MLIVNVFFMLHYKIKLQWLTAYADAREGMIKNVKGT